MTNNITFIFFYIITIVFVSTSCNQKTPSKDQPQQNTSQTQSVQQDSTSNIINKGRQPAPRTVYDTTKWVRIIDIDSTIVEDMRYATADNFVKEIMYDCGACYLRPEVAVAVGQAHQMLKEQGYGGLKMFDCYRPRPIQQKLWDKVPDARYVTPPWKGSMHNRGLAVDLTIIDSLGHQLDMGTRFDYFGVEGYHTYLGHSDEIQANRTLLKETLSKVGFRHIRTEWWHYSYRKVTYPISDWVWGCK